ncbi:MAG: hypothetical protein WDM79_14735 [Terricaulis sp.]
MRRRTFVTASLGALALPAVAWAQASSVRTPPAPITAQNALETAFLAASSNEQLRQGFRRLFLVSRVAMALSSRDPGTPPRQIELAPNVRACLIFTSAARAVSVMGDSAPIVMLTGREALERMRGTNVIINMNLTPRLTLEAEDVDAYLAMPNETPAPPPPAPRRSGSTGAPE